VHKTCIRKFGTAHKQKQIVRHSQQHNSVVAHGLSKSKSLLLYIEKKGTSILILSLPNTRKKRNKK
jgi:hypothetical protein